MNKSLKIAIILGAVIVVALSIIYLFWFSTYRVLNTNIDYITRRPVYHEYFQKSERCVLEAGRDDDMGRFRPISQVVDGKTVDLNRNTLARYVIDIATGRELMYFPALENWRSHTRRYSLQLMGDGKVKVTRELGDGSPPWIIHEVGLLDIETGRELISFDSDYTRIRAVSNGRVIVGNPGERSGHYGVMDIESGRVTVPFIYENIRFLYGNYVSVSEYRGGTCCCNRRVGLVNAYTGETIRPLIYRRILPGEDVSSSLVRFLCVDEREHTLVDLANGEEVIDLTQFDFSSIRSFGYGFVALQETHFLRSTQALIEIETAREIIPFGRFNGIQILNENSAGVYVRGEDSVISGIINIHTGEETVAFEESPLPLFLWNRYYNGMFLIRNNEGQAVVDTATGEMVIPFGTYDMIHQLLPGGLITVSVGNYWKIVSL